jgi:uncharacterized protein YegJ (DUF2314 family)
MLTTPKKVMLLLAGMFALLSCSGDGLFSPSPSQQPIPAGSLAADRMSFQFAIYYLPRPSKNPVAALDTLLKDAQATFRKVQKLTDGETTPALAVRLDEDPQVEYAPPDLSLLEYSGRGLTPQEARELQRTEMAFILDFAYSKEHVWSGMRAAVELMNNLARATGGLIWDEETREVFTPDAWIEKRLKTWDEKVPDVSSHTVTHTYQDDDGVRAITLGMAKFGLPDIVINNFSWSLSRNVGHVINLFAQAIAEGAIIERAGEFDLDFRAIRNASVREPQVTMLKQNATGIALLTLREGQAEEGDPENRLIEITFDRVSGPDIHARQTQALTDAFGADEDSVTVADHDEELLAASERARAQLTRLRGKFNQGLAPGEFILLKAPFPTPDGDREFMWVEVTSWKGNRISGTLQNEPANIPDLHSGQDVQISQAEVFDFIHSHADGTEDGNETGKILGSRPKKEEPARK